MGPFSLQHHTARLGSRDKILTKGKPFIWLNVQIQRKRKLKLSQELNEAKYKGGQGAGKHWGDDVLARNKGKMTDKYTDR